jgi:aryl-alcohol dehydrogenase-like predicted oxidoreductase
MQHVRFGSTGLQVSRLCLGTMTFGLQCDEPTSFKILDAAAEAGITFLDTADAYPLGGSHETAGRTEEIVGKWLKGRRDQFIIATKCSGKMGPKAWQQGTSRKHVLDAIDASLKRLGTDYVDLYQVHLYDAATSTDETVEAFDAVVRSGKARYIGCSNYHAYRVARSLGRSEALGLAKFASVQPRYNLLFRQIERELLPLCRREAGGDPIQPVGRRAAYRETQARRSASRGHAIHSWQRRQHVYRTLLEGSRVRRNRRSRRAREGTRH